MTNDIVNNLRKKAKLISETTMRQSTVKFLYEAADEIELLRVSLKEIIEITDRKHEVWDRAKFLIGKL